MQVAVTGSHGLIGSAVVERLRAAGHSVTRLVRSRGPLRDDEARWDPSTGEVDAVALEGHAAVIHLAGESIARRWTAAAKARVRESRVAGTRLLCGSLAELRRPPRVLVSASAIGYYGDRENEVLLEDSPPGPGYLPELCRAWEGATRPALGRRIRVVLARFGMVLSAGGGALAKMLLPFRLGLGGRLGSGRQWVSWIALDDAVGAILHALAAETLNGPVNVVSPQPVTNREFTRVLGRVLRRPAVFPVPRLVLRLLFGEMADQVLLASSRAEPRRLMASGYAFRHPGLEGALHHVLAAR